MRDNLSDETIKFFFDHFSQRLMERYNIAITLSQYLDLCDAIMNNDNTIPKVFFSKRTKRLKTWFIVFNNRWIAVWYDKELKLLRTVLPQKLVSKNLHIINRGLRNGNT